MNNIEMTEYARQFLLENYDINLHIPILRNNRLRSSYGRYVMTNQGKALRIEIAGRTLDFGREDVIKGIIKHECIHYALHMQGKDIRDGHPTFEKALQEHGAPSTNTMKIGLFYTFRCHKCDRIYETNRKQIIKTPEKYQTKCCHASIQVLEARKYDGLEFSDHF